MLWTLHFWFLLFCCFLFCCCCSLFSYKHIHIFQVFCSVLLYLVYFCFPFSWFIPLLFASFISSNSFLSLASKHIFKKNKLCALVSLLFIVCVCRYNDMSDFMRFGRALQDLFRKIRKVVPSGSQPIFLLKLSYVSSLFLGFRSFPLYPFVVVVVVFLYVFVNFLSCTYVQERGLERRAHL